MVPHKYFEDWDQFFMTLAFFVAMKSKDPSTKVGSVIRGLKNEIVSAGYNGFPRGVDDSKKERYQRPEKYSWICHSEENAIDNANKMDLDGCVLYTQWVPCSSCTKRIIQSRIKEIVVYYGHDDNKFYGKKDEDGRKNWWEDTNYSITMIKESGVKLRIYNGPIVTNIVQVCNEEVTVPMKKNKIKKTTHVCKENLCCTCYSLALEPSENCPTHGCGNYPPRCMYCGRYIKMKNK